MSDTPDKPTPSFEEMAESKPEPAPQVSQPEPAAPKKPMITPKAPVKPSISAKPNPIAAPTKQPEAARSGDASASSKESGVSPAAKYATKNSKKKANAPKSSAGESIPVGAVIIDAIAAVVAITFTVLIVQEVLPFL